MFARHVQPTSLSLFSSTGSHPLQLFSCSEGNLYSSRPLTSIRFVDDRNFTRSESDSIHTSGASSHSATLANDSVTESPPKGCLCQTVLHLQSPTVKDTFIRCPPSSNEELGLKLPWMHLQVRSLGHHWCFEIGVVDKSGRKGIIRCSTFQRAAYVKANRDVPLLHLPLRFPAKSSHLLTDWSTVDIDLQNTMQKFVAVRTTEVECSEKGGSTTSYSKTPLPSGSFDRVSYVKVYASCRLRRIWFSRDGRRGGGTPWELELYSAT